MAVVADPDARVVAVGPVLKLFGSADRVVVRLTRPGAALEPEELLILRTRHGVFAMVNRCPHLGRRLDDGELSGHTIRCAGHGRRFDVASGRALGRRMGRRNRLASLRTWVVDRELYVELESASR
jgi:nitrite reductase/ring-hydroxylating ferredoxin subunit